MIPYSDLGKMINAKAIYGFGDRKERLLILQSPVMAGSTARLSLTYGSLNVIRKPAIGAYSGSTIFMEENIASLGLNFVTAPNVNLQLGLKLTNEKINSSLLESDQDNIAGQYVDLSVTATDRNKRSIDDRVSDKRSYGGIGLLYKAGTNLICPYVICELTNEINFGNFSLMSGCYIGWSSLLTPVTHQFVLGVGAGLDSYPGGVIGFCISNWLHLSDHFPSPQHDINEHDGRLQCHHWQYCGSVKHSVDPSLALLLSKYGKSA
jgi:hypothetical protein